MSAGQESSGHIPVLLAEVVAALAPRPGDVIVDATFGAGGYTRAFLDAGATVHAFDRDPDAIAAGRAWSETKEEPPRLVLHPRRFSEMVETLTEQLDRYPWGVLRQLAHLLGAELRPARPAVGVVTLAVQQSGRLELGANPSRWRLFTPQTEDAARRFIEFVDEVYDRGVNLVLSAAAPIVDLYDGERLRAEFGRTESRLIEMQSEDYLARGHAP